MSARVKAACRRVLPAALGLLFAACVLAAPVLTVRRQTARLLAGPQPRQSAGSLFWAPAVQQSPFLYALHRAQLLGELDGKIRLPVATLPGEASGEVLDTAREKLEELYAAGVLREAMLEECRLALDTAAGLPQGGEYAAQAAPNAKILCGAQDGSVQSVSVMLDISDPAQAGDALRRFLPQTAEGDGYFAYFSLELQWLREEGHVICFRIVPFDGGTAFSDVEAWGRYLGLDDPDGWQALGPEALAAAYPTVPYYGPTYISEEAGVYLTAAAAGDEQVLVCGSLLAV